MITKHHNNKLTPAHLLLSTSALGNHPILHTLLPIKIIIIIIIIIIINLTSLSLDNLFKQYCLFWQFKTNFIKIYVYLVVISVFPFTNHYLSFSWRPFTSIEASSTGFIVFKYLSSADILALFWWSLLSTDSLQQTNN